MVVDDTVHISRSNDAEDTIRRAILADYPINIHALRYIHHRHMVCSKDLQDRNTYVWQESIVERDIQMDKILI